MMLPDRVHLKGLAQRSYMLAPIEPPDCVTSLPRVDIESVHALGGVIT